MAAFFDCPHDMGDPVGAAAHTLRSLKPDGTMVLVEPFGAGSGDTVYLVLESRL